jgi:hypothetical protein
MDSVLSGEFAKVRAEQKFRNTRGAYFWLVMVAYMVACPAIGILVSRQISISVARDAARESELKLCAIVVTADDAYKAAPPSGPTVKKQAANMAKLRRDYHCPPNAGVKR